MAVTRPGGHGSSSEAALLAAPKAYRRGLPWAEPVGPIPYHTCLPMRYPFFPYLQPFLKWRNEPGEDSLPKRSAAAGSIHHLPGWHSGKTAICWHLTVMPQTTWKWPLT
jgi:hypothetical protein